MASERGECSFVSKAIKAMEAGAVAAIITDNDAENDEMYVAMQGRTNVRQGCQMSVLVTILKVVFRGWVANNRTTIGVGL